MAAKKSTSPQITNPYAPLEQLALRALRRYGEMSPSTMDGDTLLVFIDHANSTLDDVMGHAYWQKGVTIPYYTHITDTRPVPDGVILAGILARYALDQESSKGNTLVNEYFLKLNQLLLREKMGVGSEFELQAVDYQEGGVK